MKSNLRKLRHTLPLMLCLIAPAPVKADMLLQVNIPTTNLTSQVGPFTVFFQMFRDGTNVFEAPRNLVTVSDFEFGGGHAESGALTNYGGGSGNMAGPTGQVQLADSAIVNVHSQRFQPGTQFQFKALLTSVRSFNGPASFSLYLLGTNGLPIPTTSSLDEFLRIDLDDLRPALKLFRSDLSNTTFNIPQPTALLTNVSKLPQFTLKVTTDPGTNGNLRLDFPEAKFADLFELEASIDLQTWTNLGPRAYVGEPLIFSDPDRTNFPIRFYRASMPNAPQPIQSTPLITSQPTSRTNLVGTTASFNVVAAGALPLSYRWRHNGTDLLSQTNASLSLLNVQIADQGGYDMVVSNPYGAVTSSVAMLTVAIPQDPAMDFTAPGNLHTDASYSMGFEFDALQAITVTTLGMYDDDTNGFAESHDVGIFSTNGLLLASTTVFSTNQLIGYFRYQQITPLNLPAGSGYRVAAVTGTERFTWAPSGPTTNSLIRFVRDRWTPFATSLVLPSSSDGRLGYFGANFLLTTSTNHPP